MSCARSGNDYLAARDARHEHGPRGLPAGSRDASGRGRRRERESPRPGQESSGAGDAGAAKRGRARRQRGAPHGGGRPARTCWARTESSSPSEPASTVKPRHGCARTGPAGGAGPRSGRPDARRRPGGPGEPRTGAALLLCMSSTGARVYPARPTYPCGDSLPRWTPTWPWPTLRRLADSLTAGALRELDLTPKPGLVDRHDNGSHPDLTYARMRASVRLLPEYYADLLARLRAGSPLASCIEAGRLAEARMVARVGSNMSPGLYFSLGTDARGSTPSAGRARTAANRHGRRGQGILPRRANGELARQPGKPRLRASAGSAGKPRSGSPRCSRRHGPATRVACSGTAIAAGRVSRHGLADAAPGGYDRAPPLRAGGSRPRPGRRPGASGAAGSKGATRARFSDAQCSVSTGGADDGGRGRLPGPHDGIAALLRRRTSAQKARPRE